MIDLTDPSDHKWGKHPNGLRFWSRCSRCGADMCKSVFSTSYFRVAGNPLECVTGTPRSTAPRAPDTPDIL